MINPEADITASAAIERIEALAASSLGPAERAFLDARPDLYPALTGTLELIRQEFPAERIAIHHEYDPGEGSEWLGVDVWLPAATAVKEGLEREQRFADRWMLTSHFAVPRLSVGIRFDDGI